MSFRNGAYFKIWNVVDKGNFAEVEMSSSVKNKTTGKYDTDFSCKYVRFVGDAYRCRPMSGQRVQIGECEVKNAYRTKEGGTAYMKNPMYVVYKYSLQDDDGNSAKTNLDSLVEVNEVLPF